MADIDMTPIGESWQEVGRVDFGGLTLKQAQAALISLLEQHGSDAKIVSSQYQVSNSTTRSEGFVEPSVFSYYKVMKLLPLYSTEQRLAMYTERSAEQKAEAERTKALRQQRAINFLQRLRNKQNKT